MLKPHTPTFLYHTPLLHINSSDQFTFPVYHGSTCVCDYPPHRASHLLSKVTKLEEVVPGLLHPVGAPVPQAVGLAQQDGVVAPRPRSLSGRQIVQSLNLQQYGSLKKRRKVDAVRRQDGSLCTQKQPEGCMCMCMCSGACAQLGLCLS